MKNSLVLKWTYPSLSCPLHERFFYKECNELSSCVSYLEKWHDFDNTPFRKFCQLDPNKPSSFEDLIRIADKVKITSEGTNCTMNIVC
jgi:hypothetical protein